ncbi:MAG TPA: hypothetical protein VIV66_21395, partial [Pyrinomonadaceae bacterium]
MFCPKCGATQNDALKFCNLCGANLYAVRQVVDSRMNEKFDWSKTWVADMFLSEDERKRRQTQLDLERGITPEVKHANEIKAGVITTCVGVALMIFLFFFMEGIIRSGQAAPGEAEILSRVWFAGFIPFMIGIGLIINGAFVSKRLLKVDKDTSPPKSDRIERGTEARSLGPVDTAEFDHP